MKDLTSYIKENDSDVVELDILKKILITLSKEIPNSEYEDDKKYLDEFNDIKSDIDALKLLNNRLSDLVPRTRTINYIFDDEINYTSQWYKGNTIDVHLSSYGDWSKEFDTSGEDMQLKKAYVNSYLTVNLKSSNIASYSDGKYIYLGYIDEGNTNNYTILNGFIPCCVVTTTEVLAMAYLRFENNMLYLYANDFSFLTDTKTEVDLMFNGMIDYESYEDYRQSE